MKLESRNILAVAISVCVGIVFAASLLHNNGRGWIISGLCVAALILVAILWRSVVLPGNIVKRGLEILASQDFNNRLLNVGEPHSDRIVALFNTMIDRLREERLHNMEQESFLRLLVEASSMGVLILDFDGKVSVANRAFVKLSGQREPVSPESLVGKRLEELGCDNGLGLSGLPLGENVIVRLGGSRLVRVSHQSFMQMGFNRSFYLLENLTEEVMRAEREAYGKVIRTISHEVNNTMGGVRSVLDMMTGVSGDSELDEVLRSCDVRCGEMSSFISSYADVVRLPEPVFAELDLGELVGEMRPFLEMMVGPEINLTVAVSEGDGVIKGDRAQLEQVILNIVKNGKESFGGPVKDGWISLKVGRERHRVSLDISNNGEPIREEVARQLFSPFFTTKRNGKGIGLTLISEILNRHHAEYSLTTDQEGITHFRIVFR